MSKIVVIGARGQLGSELVKLGRALGHEVVEFNREDHPITCPGSIKMAIFQEKPDLVINTAAFHDVVACEHSPVQAFAVNAIAPADIADACALVGAFNIFISTDYVFGGCTANRAFGYKEDAVVSPLNAYGHSKAAGEHYTRSINPDCSAVVRVSYLYGRYASKQKGGNFVTKVLGWLDEGKQLTFHGNMIVTSTYAKDAARFIFDVFSSGIGDGIYHANNCGAHSLYQFARSIAMYSGFDPEIVIAGKYIQSECPVPVRPRYSAMFNNTAINTRSWQDALQRYLTEIGRNRVN